MPASAKFCDACGAQVSTLPAEPVPVYLALASKVVSAKPRGIVGLESPLVGRQDEFGHGCTQ